MAPWHDVQLVCPALASTRFASAAWQRAHVAGPSTVTAANACVVWQAVHAVLPRAWKARSSFALVWHVEHAAADVGCAAVAGAEPCGE